MIIKTEESHLLKDRRLSLITFDDTDNRQYFQGMEQVRGDQGEIEGFRPFFSINPNDALGFDSIKIANQFKIFIEKNMEREFMFCILPKKEDVIPKVVKKSIKPKKSVDK